MPFQTITKGNTTDPTYKFDLPEIDTIYKFNQPLPIDLEKLISEFIIPEADEVATGKYIKLTIKENWKQLEFTIKEYKFHISFQINDKKQYSHFKTNCSPYLLQDIIHSLPNEKAKLFIKALKKTAYEIRELSKTDIDYRKKQREIKNQNSPRMQDQLLQAQSEYRENSYVKAQMKLPVLGFYSADIFSYNFSYDMHNSTFTKSIPIDQFPAYRSKIENIIDKFTMRFADPKTFNDYVKRIQESYGLLANANFLDVGFGDGANLLRLKTKQPFVKVYGVEPNKKDFNFFIENAKEIDPKNFHCMSIQDYAIKYPDPIYDLIVMSLFAIPRNEYDAVFTAIAKLSRPETGKILITCYDEDYADPKGKLTDKSLAPYLLKYFGDVKRGAYDPDSFHTFTFVCSKPFLNLALNTRPMPNVKRIGLIQKYFIPTLNEEIQHRILESGGTIETVMINQNQMTFALLNTNILKSTKNGGLREEFGLDRVTVKADFETMLVKCKNIQERYPEVTMETDLERPGHYLFTFPKELRPKLENIISPSKDTSATRIQSTYRGMWTRKRTTPIVEEIKKTKEEIKDAINQNDFNRAEELIQKIKTHQMQLEEITVPPQIKHV